MYCGKSPGGQLLEAAVLQCEMGNCEGMDLVFYSGFRDFAFRDKVANLYLEVEAIIGLES